MTIDLGSLEPPQAIETPDDGAILADLKADLIGRYPEIEPFLDLENEPVTKVLETAAYRELILRARINDVLRSRLIAFAEGADLEHLAAFYEVARLPGEQDEPFRERIFLEMKARSPGGGAYWYEAAARRADVRVKSAIVWRETLLPIIHIAILSTDDGGIPSPDLLEAVSAVVQSPTVRLVNDTVIVEAAVSQTTAIEADIWLLPNAAATVLDQLAPALRAAWDQESGIGFDLEPSWLEARLHQPGVKRVGIVSPAGPVIAPDGVALALGAIKLNFRGYDY